MPVPRRLDGNHSRSRGSSPDWQINIRPVPESKRSRSSPLQRTHQKVCQGWVTFLGRGLSRQLLVSVIRVPTIRGGRDRFCLVVMNHRFSTPGTGPLPLDPEKSPPVRVADTIPCTNPKSSYGSEDIFSGAASQPASFSAVDRIETSTR